MRIILRRFRVCKLIQNNTSSSCDEDNVILNNKINNKLYLDILSREETLFKCVYRVH